MISAHERSILLPNPAWQAPFPWWLFPAQLVGSEMQVVPLRSEHKPRLTPAAALFDFGPIDIVDTKACLARYASFSPMHTILHRPIKTPSQDAWRAWRQTLSNVGQAVGLQIQRGTLTETADRSQAETPPTTLLILFFPLRPTAVRNLAPPRTRHSCARGRAHTHAACWHQRFAVCLGCGGETALTNTHISSSLG